MRPALPFAPRCSIPRTLSRIVAFASLCATTVAAEAQVVRGTVSGSTDLPVTGALVSLLDEQSVVVARALTDDAGMFRLLAPRAGAFRLRTARIGFRPAVSAPIELRVGNVRDERVRIDFVPVGLDTLRVASRAVCRRVTGDTAAATFALWDQARTAFSAAQITSGNRGLEATTITYERRYAPTLQRGERRVLSQKATVQSAMVSQPWKSHPVDSLRRYGYVRDSDDGTLTYFAPDLTALTSTAFLEDHCLRLTAGADSAEVGIAFEPTRERNGVPEVAGTVYLARASSELRRLEFRYVQIAALRAEQAGGILHFARLGGGAWAISRWEVRMPVVERLTARALPKVTAVEASGGELVMARRGRDTLFQRSSLAMHGMIVDSMTGAPIANARVALEGTDERAVTDVRGAFRFPSMLPGEYSALVQTPALDSVNAVHKVHLAFVDSAHAVRVTVPGVLHVVRSLCGAAMTDTHGSAVLGTVRRANDSASLAGVRVVAEWRNRRVTGESDEWRRLETRTDASGGFRLCGDFGTAVVSVRALPPIGRAQIVERALSSSVRVAGAELVVDTAAAPVARLRGVVVSADSAAQPIRDAEVLLPALNRTVRTDSRGGFRMDEIPVGTHQLVVRRLGYGGLDTPLTFEANEDESRRVVLSRITVLDSVDVRAENAIPSFEEHRRVGLGHFLTREELAKMENRTLPALLSNFNGTRFVQGKAGRVWLAGGRGPQSITGLEMPGLTKEDLAMGARKACYSRIYIDNQPIYSARNGEPLFDIRTIIPSEIEALEYYSNPAQTPARYSQLGATCGVLVIWTRKAL
ncbi:MAG: carboxypeptidase regulatory-like domain-containing protein [Gemmatimonadaceae bacterium]|nr:carboxypeptidase regulatory-like domain-containing protein [Gemmatimonadaceae bacterium]